MADVDLSDEVEIFPNPPITEAVLEFQLRLEGDAHLGRLAAVQDSIKSAYPQRRDSKVLSAGVQLPSGSMTPWTNAEARQVGYSFGSADGKQVIQARLNGFAFSRLKPYESWKKFRREAHEMWEHYKKFARPERVSRVGLRYINRVEIPLPISDFSEYILTKVDIAPGLPNAVSALALQVVVRDSATGGGVILNQAIDPNGASPTHLPLVFDIDAFKEVDLPADSPDLWQTVAVLRKMKDDFFFKSFTEKARELFR